MLEQIFSTLGSGLVALFQAIGDAATGAVGLFFKAGEGGAYSITPLGTLLLVGMACSLAFWAIRLVRGFASSRRIG